MRMLPERLLQRLLRLVLLLPVLDVPLILQRPLLPLVRRLHIAAGEEGAARGVLQVRLRGWADRTT